MEEKNSLFCQLGARLLALLAGFAAAELLLLAAGPAAGLPPKPVYALALLGVLLFGGALLWQVWWPLRQIEAVLQAQEPIDSQKGSLARSLLGQKIVALKEQSDTRYNTFMLEKQTELEGLQSQINPHFLYNTLESIRGKAVQQGQQEIADMTEALSKFFRYSISLKDNIVSLEEELENARNYFKIQQFRFNNRFDLCVDDADPELLLRCRLPKLTLQPIIENAIYHGLEPQMRMGAIRIQVVETGYNTLIIVGDNGLGMDEETLHSLQDRIENGKPAHDASKNGGIALPNVHRRIQLTFGPQYGLQVTSTPGLGTDVEIVLPAIREG